MVERAGSTLTVDSSVKLWHTVLQMGLDREPCGVAITNNPLEYDKGRVMAQIVMHKTRSMNCAVQVARYVRRTFDIEAATSTHRAARFVEAKIGYVCMGGYQHGPENLSERYTKVVAHIAGTSIKQLLEEVAGGLNAARTRYIVYEVRELAGQKRRWRAVTNKMHAVERVWRQCPADTVERADIIHVGKFETMDLAKAACGSFPKPDDLWTKRPSAEYMRKVLKKHGETLVWASDGSEAVRRYDTVASPVVCVGPHVYTLPHVLHVLETGQWYDGYFRKASGPGL